ncbi:hypothetical protein GPECTOR_3g253 [Gonium pectorale]|uniref:non-specific serine/threonine protein kinase n=1 Tax=Gonium pectorale TaxID=33097 RepID=A0A150GZ23_GONPE|nr:hypothetical protein GPECTOR_3g253 [Gonium pectorale]|eukprot:KXZ55099.1 hypothetical protein GPECTOR_3g253 [Gonium pectorale]
MLLKHPQHPPAGADPSILAAAEAAVSSSSEAQLRLAEQQPRSGAAASRLPVGVVPFEPGRVLGGGRYTVEEVLGAGSNAVAYRARRPDGSEVALKALSLRGLRDWKALELFQREGQVLASLQHPAIPRYLDYFEEDDPKDRAFVLVQEVVKGKSLAAMITGGQRATEQEVSRIAGELLSVLQYLSSLRPPVVHRDIKPENIVLEGGAWGGRVFLVDFGGVQAVASAGELAGLGSTIVGTYGYMAPEQFRGAAEPASDLYGLGGTLLYMITGQPPSAFPTERMRINWRSSASSSAAPASPALAALVDGLLEPLVEDRLTAAEAVEVLQGKASGGRGAAGRREVATSGFARRRQRAAPAPPATPEEAYMRQAMALSRPPARLARPTGSRVQLQRSEDGRLDVVIPPKGFTADTAFTGTFALAWNAFVAFWTVGALASGGLLFALFSAPFWFAGVQIARGAIGGALTRERLAVGRKRWRLAQQLALLGSEGQADFLEGQNERLQEGSSANLTAARVVTIAFINGNPQTAIEILEGANRYRMGEGLETVEQQWLVQEINDTIADLKGQDVDYESLPPPEMPRILNDDNTSDRD